MNTPSSKNPYPGPRPFEESEGNLFFGRDQEKLGLISKIVAHRVVILHAQSGAGKTSMLNACLLPALKNEGFDVFPVVRLGVPIPGDIRGNEIENIFAFNTLMAWEKQIAARPLVNSRINEFLYHDYIQKLSHQDSPAPRVIIFDQSEELFTAYAERWEEREGLFKQLGKALEPDPKRWRERGESLELSGRALQPDRSLRVVFIIREDYLANLHAYADLLPVRPAVRAHLERLRKDAACEAIEGPAGVVGRYFADGVAPMLVEKLLESRVATSNGKLARVRGEFVEPVQLQIVCNKLLENMPDGGREITAADLQALGDVDEPLAGYYNESIEKVTKDTGAKEGALRDWFEHALITSSGTRGTVYMDIESGTTGVISNTAVIEFEKLHLVRGEERAGGRWYELTHDRFIEPIVKSNRKWRDEHSDAVRQELEKRAAEWTRSELEKYALLNEEELVSAELWITSSEAAELGYSSELVAFIRASRAEIDRKRLEKLQAVSKLRKRAVTLVILVAALVILVGVGWGMFASAQLQKGRVEALYEELKKVNEELVKAKETAEGQKKEAQDASALAKKNSETAQVAGALAERRRKEAEEANALAQQRRTEAEDASTLAQVSLRKAYAATALAEQGQREAEEQRKRADEAVKFADESKTSAKTEQRRAEGLARIFLARNLAAASLSGQNTSDESALLSLYSVSEPFKSDGKIFRDGMEAMSRTVSGLLLRQILPTHSDNVANGRFSSDGKFISTVSDDGAVRMWNVSSQTESPVNAHYNETPGKARIFALSPTGKTVAVVRGTDRIEVWDLTSDSRVPIRKFYDTYYHTLPQTLVKLRFSPDGRYLASASSFGRYAVMDLSSVDKKRPKILWHKPGLVGKVRERVFAPLSNPASAFAFNRGQGEFATFAVGFKNGKLLIYAVGSGRCLIELETGEHADRHADEILAMDFSPDGRLLVTGSRDKKIKIWDSSDLLDRSKDKKTLRLIKELSDHKNAVSAVEFSPNGNIFATGSEDRTTKLWDAKSFQLLDTLPASDGYINAISFNADGSLLATFAADKAPRVWDVSLAPKLVDVRKQIEQAQNSRQYDQFGVAGKSDLNNTPVDITGLLTAAKGLLPKKSFDDLCKKYLNQSPCPPLP